MLNVYAEYDYLLLQIIISSTYQGITANESHPTWGSKPITYMCRTNVPL